MYWTDEIVKKLKENTQHVADGKTPSGRIHVGSLRGVLIHDVIVRALTAKKTKTTFSYIFDDFDPFDSIPAGLERKKFEKYLGMPLNKVPSPDDSADSFGQFFANEFIDVFNALEVHPEILWQTKLHQEGTLNEAIKIALDHAEKIQEIYQKVSGSKKREEEWLPFQPICQRCGKIGTTKATTWDGKEVEYECLANLVAWAKGCDYKGKVSPFDETGKLPWKVYWPARWFALKTTVEGEGKDLASKGGARDVANHIAKEIYKIDPPLDIPYEFFLYGGAKMSTSKGVGMAAKEIVEILPPELIRFLMLQHRPMQAINFDPYDPSTIPKLFDEYDKTQAKKMVRFKDVVNVLQMPGKEKELEEEHIRSRVQYAKIWLDRFAPEDQKFTVKEEFPQEALHLSGQQKEFLSKVINVIPGVSSADELQTKMYELSKGVGLSSKEAFATIYLSLLGKDHGPKAAWLIVSLDKKFVVERFKEAASSSVIPNSVRDLGSDEILKQVQHDNISLEIFSIDKEVKKKFPSISVGVAIIKGVKIEKSNKHLEKEKVELLRSFENENLTTEQLSQYPEVQSYRKLYKETGIDWHSRRPSPEALLRRVALKKGLYNINTCVDAYNLVVMKYRVSVGAFDLDAMEFPTILRFAKEGEKILLLGDTEPTKYEEGEIAYFDQKGGFNIDFNYRDAQRTAVQLSTKNLYINVDGVFDITPEKVQQVLQETCNIITKNCGGEVELFGVETAP